jgi:hypothetical protein
MFPVLFFEAVKMPVSCHLTRSWRHVNYFWSMLSGGKKILRSGVKRIARWEKIYQMTPKLPNGHT